jgi:hypothetical protein
MKLIYFFVLIFFIAQSQTALAQQNTHTADGRKVLYKYAYPGDNTYHYGVMNNEWYARNIKTGKTFNISRNPQFISTIKKLDAQYPEARYEYKSPYQENGEINFIYTYPGDKQYVYGVKKGEWYTKNVMNNKIFNISRNAKFRSTITKLDQMYPGVR